MAAHLFFTLLMMLVGEVPRAEGGKASNEATSNLKCGDEHGHRHVQVHEQSDLNLLLPLVAETVPARLALFLVDRDLLLCVLVPRLWLAPTFMARLALSGRLVARGLIFVRTVGVFLRKAAPESRSRGGRPVTLEKICEVWLMG